MQSSYTWTSTFCAKRSSHEDSLLNKTKSRSVSGSKGSIQCWIVQNEPVSARKRSLQETTSTKQTYEFPDGDKVYAHSQSRGVIIMNIVR